MRTHRILFNLISMHKHQVWHLNSSLTSTLVTSNSAELKKQAKSPADPLTHLWNRQSCTPRLGGRAQGVTGLSASRTGGGAFVSPLQSCYC